MKVTIDVEFGSDWQKECCSGMLDTLLTAFKIQAESQHQKNKVTINKKA